MCQLMAPPKPKPAKLAPETGAPNPKARQPEAMDDVEDERGCPDSDDDDRENLYPSLTEDDDGKKRVGSKATGSSTPDKQAQAGHRSTKQRTAAAADTQQPVPPARRARAARKE